MTDRINSNGKSVFQLGELEEAIVQAIDV